MNEGFTDYGFERVGARDKARRVAAVFDSVASRYDLMNDLMSAGLHRLWKRFAVDAAKLRPGQRVLDIAGGTGDITRLVAGRVGAGGEVWLTDINAAMLTRGRDRLLDKGVLTPVLRCDAEKLPFPNEYFDCVTIAFGLRNVSSRDAALREMARVLRFGGRLIVLEFSKVWEPLRKAYDLYSFNVIPRLGAWVAGDADSYRYLAESIRTFPDQDALRAMIEAVGLQRVEYFNLSGGVCAVHRGVKL
jgi:demethylmenaquinone methyltransferase/2-methoxy-6-polyprenyl-1,4-benzoquinol methylase